MSVSSATVGQPTAAATVCRLRASAVAASIGPASPPDPTLTSIASASSPAASFLERIDAVMSGMESSPLLHVRHADGARGDRATDEAGEQ